MKWLFIRLKRRKQPPRLAQNLSLGQRCSWYILALLGLILLHTLAMMALEGLSVIDSVWLTVTTITTVGYGDLSATSPLGRLSTFILMYLAGVFVFAQILSVWLDYRDDRRQRRLKGYWRWNMQQHLVIINAPIHHGTRYFERMIGQLRAIPEFKQLPIQLLTTDYNSGLPQTLQQLGVVHFSGDPLKPLSLEAVDIQAADYIIVLAQDADIESSDSTTFDILHRLKEVGVNNKVVVECVNDINRQRFTALGVQSVIRPVRAYPEFLVRALVSPGSEQVLENLFTHHGDHIQRFDVKFTDRTWTHVVCVLMESGLGTAVAYINDNGAVICNPEPDQMIKGKGLILMVRAVSVPTIDALQMALSK